MGLDPQGYGNPDFCWLSLRDTLIWSFAGPIGTVIVVSARGFSEPLIIRVVGGRVPLGYAGLKGVWGRWVTSSAEHLGGQEGLSSR